MIRDSFAASTGGTPVSQEGGNRLKRMSNDRSNA
jgi:hypothetical protein